MTNELKVGLWHSRKYLFWTNGVSLRQTKLSFSARIATLSPCSELAQLFMRHCFEWAKGLSMHGILYI